MPGLQPKVIDVDRAARLYESGLSLRQVSAQVGLSPSQLWSRLLAVGVTMRPKKVRGPVADDRVIELRAQGLTWQQMGDAVGMSATGVRARYLRVTGWPAEAAAIPGRPRVSDDHVLDIIEWGATHREAAEMLGLTVGAVTSRVYRARLRRRT